MALNDLLKPKWLLGALVIIIFAVLMFMETVPTEVGVLVIVGILGALGLWEGGKELGKREVNNGRR